MNRLLQAAGHDPLLWIVCERTRVAAVRPAAHGQPPGLVDGENLWDVLADRVVLTVRGVDGGRIVDVLAVTIRCAAHGTHDLDGARVARVVRVAAGSTDRRVSVADLAPR